jgi:ABC-2 type transport system ATP-binding protein
LKAAQKGHVLQFVTEKPQRANNRLKEQMDRWRISLFGDRLHVIVDEDPQVGIQNISAKLAAEGISVISAQVEPFSLEDVFISVVEKMRKEGKTAEEE